MRAAAGATAWCRSVLLLIVAASEDWLDMVDLMGAGLPRPRRERVGAYSATAGAHEVWEFR